MRKILFDKRTLCLYGVFLLAGQLAAQINYPDKIRLNDGWEYLQGDLGSVWEALRPVAKADDPETLPLWKKVTLPHCFNAIDAVDPDVNYYQGPGWYRATLSIRNPYPDGRTLLHFEGAGQKIKVYVYRQEVASHVGGYDEWTVDITDAIKSFLQSADSKRFAGKIPLLIRCDNSRDAEMIPSNLSDFNIYGGIYRYLNLVYSPSLTFSGIQLETSLDLKKEEGKLILKGNLVNPANLPDADLKIEIYHPEGALLKETQIRLQNFTGGELFTASIEQPLYWSPETPRLYSCRLTLSSAGGTITFSEKFGFRQFEFKEKGPFYLNGERLLLRGTHRHEDHAGLAAAMTEDLIIKEMQLIKAMGANFIRLGHYQQSRIVLEQCDELGLLVWEEIPWCRGGLGNEVYQAQAKRMLTNMITQHRNHPSVILWGLGNENDWPNDFPVFDPEAIRAFMKELHDLAHSLDPFRKTSIRRCEFCKDIVDVYSPSIWMGWYSGKYTDYQETVFKQMQTVDHFFHAEWGGDSHAGSHAEYPNEGSLRPATDGDWSETYICDLVDWHLKEQENMPWLTGSACWTFKDFSTPIRPENPVPYVNQKGVVSRDLVPKESYFVFQSYWTEKPMIHIYGHTWLTRWGSENELKQIKVYSNCDEVELYLNGVSLGRKQRNSPDFPAAGLRWETALKPGKNRVKAIGKKDQTSLSDEITFEYQTGKWGQEAQIQLSIREENTEFVWIEAQLKDAAGVLCLDSKKFLTFDAIGAGELIIHQGTSTASKKVQAGNGRARIKLNKKGGKSIVACKSADLETVFMEIN